MLGQLFLALNGKTRKLFVSLLLLVLYCFVCFFVQTLGRIPSTQEDSLCPFSGFLNELGDIFIYFFFSPTLQYQARFQT